LDARCCCRGFVTALILTDDGAFGAVDAVDIVGANMTAEGEEETVDVVLGAGLAQGAAIEELPEFGNIPEPTPTPNPGPEPKLVPGINPVLGKEDDTRGLAPVFGPGLGPIPDPTPGTGPFVDVPPCCELFESEVLTSCCCCFFMTDLGITGNKILAISPAANG